MAIASRVAVVTGAAQGIGLNIALRLADDGLDVAVNDTASKSEQLEEVVSQIRAKGRRAIAVLADVTQETQVEDMVSQVVEQLGSLDMVANAGVLVVQPIMEVSAADWDRVMAVNVRGTMLCYKYAAKQMVKQGRGGRIIGWAGISAYCASKFAIRGLTQSTADELAKHNITVNTYAPGIIKSSMADLPLADPEVVAAVVSFLIRPESYFITGQSISPNGGAVFD
ncbi:hypothetical protein POSPLADRAFT_1138933 [Postia placenta MAD-698-R-SB12]|uniref:NAD-binding protein n=1 Tax=Postia placenta MAD-698-R-SB12 TaxID=670580 RepID=A0A1X6N4Z4_9APHY|nr:hypothetical protein POSPLADRAFT_1138933 [Postia placenta MAD-698-R-SB12]OSX63546.1 hypothetical protein POSPLADRAFT_1138933 [Postia placenta MAD-698-R-SB12]